MSHAATLARPYARAAFSLAREHGGLPAWSDALGFAAQVAADPRVQALLGHPLLDAAGKVALLSPPQAPAGDVFARFLGELAAHDRLPLLPEIAALYAQLRSDAERVVKATVTSAAPLASDQVEALRGSLAKRFGQAVEIELAVDPSLIGGAVIAAGDVVIDGSLRAKLARLGTALAH